MRVTIKDRLISLIRQNKHNDESQSVEGAVVGLKSVVKKLVFVTKNNANRSGRGKIRDTTV